LFGDDTGFGAGTEVGPGKAGVGQVAGPVAAGRVAEQAGRGKVLLPRQHAAHKAGTPEDDNNINPLPAPDAAGDINKKDRLQRFPELRLSPRVLLQAGDKIRVSAGPHYEGHAADGTPARIKMAERGVMIFEEYCELGTRRWIVARGKAGFAALHIGPEEVSSEIPGLIRRPYRVTKVRMKDRPGGSARSGRQKKTRRKPVRQPAAQTQALPAAAPGLAICSDPRRE
jgi:hypothetical protein